MLNKKTAFNIYLTTLFSSFFLKIVKINVKLELHLLQ